MEKLVDLHTHTNASDGSLSPRKLVELAKQQGLSAIAVTDHDTTDGLAEAMQAGKELGVEVIPGVELNALYGEYPVHILGLFIPLQSKELEEFLAVRKTCRQNRNRRMLSRLEAAGLPISAKEVAEAGNGTITRAHMAQVLIQNGAAKDIDDAVTRYLSKGKPGYVRMEGTTPLECIHILHRVGALAFVAHPNQISRHSADTSLAVCRRILQWGADGLETRYCQYDRDWQARTLTMAEEFNCLQSGGSDYHGPIKPGLLLGSGYGELGVPYSFVEKMKERLL